MNKAMQKILAIFMDWQALAFRNKDWPPLKLNKKNAQLLNTPLGFSARSQQLNMFIEEVKRGLKPMIYGVDFVVMSRKQFDEMHKKAYPKNENEQTMVIFDETSTLKPKVWSRKGRCPGCDVGTGSKHSRGCDYYYTATKKNGRTA